MRSGFTLRFFYFAEKCRWAFPPQTPVVSPTSPTRALMSGVHGRTVKPTNTTRLVVRCTSEHHSLRCYSISTKRNQPHQHNTTIRRENKHDTEWGLIYILFGPTHDGRTISIRRLNVPIYWSHGHTNTASKGECMTMRWTKTFFLTVEAAGTPLQSVSTQVRSGDTGAF